MYTPVSSCLSVWPLSSCFLYRSNAYDFMCGRWDDWCQQGSSRPGLSCCPGYQCKCHLLWNSNCKCRSRLFGGRWMRARAQSLPDVYSTFVHWWLLTSLWMRSLWRQLGPMLCFGECENEQMMLLGLNGLPSTCLCISHNEPLYRSHAGYYNRSLR